MTITILAGYGKGIKYISVVCSPQHSRNNKKGIDVEAGGSRQVQRPREM